MLVKPLKIFSLVYDNFKILFYMSSKFISSSYFNYFFNKSFSYFYKILLFNDMNVRSNKILHFNKLDNLIYIIKSIIKMINITFVILTYFFFFYFWIVTLFGSKII